MSLDNRHCIATFPKATYVSGEARTVSIRRIAFLNGMYWLWGTYIFMVSRNGRDWKDIASNLRDEGGFAVCEVMEAEGQIFIFARTRSGLCCYRFDEISQMWRPRGGFKSEADCALGVRIRHAFIGAASDGLNTSIFAVSSTGDHIQPLLTLAGSVTYLDVCDDGRGFCLTWQRQRRRDNYASNIYRTEDSGAHWELEARLDGMLLCGSILSDSRLLVGGTNGLLAIVDRQNIEIQHQAPDEEVVALDSNSRFELAIVESGMEQLFHQVLVRAPMSQWSSHFYLRFYDRVSCAQLTEANTALICTTNALYEVRVDELLSDKPQLQ